MRKSLILLTLALMALTACVQTISMTPKMTPRIKELNYMFFIVVR